VPELYRLADQTHVNTQADAKHSGQPWEKVEVPTKRHELLAYLNEIVSSVRGGISSDTPPAADTQEPEIAEVESSQTHTPAPAPPPPPAPPARILEREEIEDRILESTGATFGAYLACAIGRLGELGREGWSQFSSFRHFCQDAERSQARDKHKRLATFEERGLRYLALMQVRDLDNGGPLE
jgi:hypothetical protein